MKLLKRLLCASLSAALCAQLSLTVFADSGEEKDTLPDGGITQIPAGENIEYPYGDDPSYLKYLDRQDKTGAVFGSEDLSHASRFSGVSKDYGIDVSYYQSWGSEINWEKVKKAGIKFVIVRIGYRGYGSQGTLVMDEDLYLNLDGAIDAGLDVGAYFYTQAINTAEAKEEAKFCANLLKGYKLDMPVYYDIEGVDYDVGRLDSAGLSKTEKTKLCETFCKEIQSAGYYSGIYTNYSWLTYEIDGAALGKKYPIWLAHYTDSTDYPDNYDLWQYSGMGTVDGIENYVDMNVRYKVNYAPTGAVKLSKSGVDLSWNSVAGASGYTVYSKDQANTVKTVKDLTGTSYTAASSVELTYYVKPYFSYGGKKYYGKASNSVTVEAASVTGLSVSSVKQDSVTLKWNSVKGASGYQIYMDQGSGYKLSKTTSSSSVTIENLLSGKSYRFKVCAFFSSGEGLSTGAFTPGMMIKTVPQTPGRYTVSAAGTGSVSIRWDESAGADGYEISVYNSDTGKYTVSGLSDSGEYTLSGLSAGKNYQVAIRSYVDLDSGRYYSPYSALRTCTTAPVKATGLTVKDLGNHNSVRFSWNKVPGATSYQLYRTENGVDKWFATSDTNSATVSYLSLGKSYSVKVRALRKVNNLTAYGEFSSPVSFDMNYSSPTGLEILNKYDDTSFTLKWDPVKYSTGYKVYRYIGGKYVFYTTVPAGVTTAYISGLTPNTSYRLAVKARFGSKDSEYSSYIIGYTRPAAPTGLKSGSVTSSGAKISWTAAKNATTYRVYVFDESKNDYYIYAETPYTTINLSGLRSGKEYKIRVSSVVETKWRSYYSNKSDLLKFRTK
ncbi:MAG: fibronectin type III domain-containing protein [Ruminococcus sp.]|nr:fibronectin type III domain-containing protein [Ruminococcus sp.]